MQLARVPFVLELFVFADVFVLRRGFYDVCLRERQKTWHEYSFFTSLHLKLDVRPLLVRQVPSLPRAGCRCNRRQSTRREIDRLRLDEHAVLAARCLQLVI